MLTYTVWGESGGIGKTTFAYNLASAHQRMGYNTLVIDMDTQDGGLTKHAGLLHVKSDPDVEKFVEHMVDFYKAGDIEDTIYTHPDDEFDIIPSHDRLGKLKRYISHMRKDKDLTGTEGKKDDEEIQDYELLQKTLNESNLMDGYDILIVDPPGKTSLELKNALYATSNLVAPVEVSPKGKTSVRGLKSEKEVVEEDLGIDIGVIGLVPNQVSSNVNVKEKSFESITSDTEFGIAPVAFDIREALINGAWAAEKSVFEYAENDKERLPSREKDTLKRFHYLAGLITGDYTPDQDPLELALPIERRTGRDQPQPRDENGNFISWDEVEGQEGSERDADTEPQASADD